MRSSKVFDISGGSAASTRLEENYLRDNSTERRHVMPGNAGYHQAWAAAALSRTLR